MPSRPKKLEEVAESSQSALDYSEYNFYVKTIQGSTIKALCEVLKDIVHDVTLKFKPNEGITCNCLEGSKVCIVYMFLYASRMEIFRCDKEECVSLSMDQLSLVTSMCGHSDQMALYQHKAEPNYINVLIEAQDNSMRSRFKLRLKAMDVYNIDLDCTEYLSIVTMPSAFFSTLCRRCSKLHDELIIESLNDCLKIGVEGPWAEGFVEIDQTNDCKFKMVSDEYYRAKFALRYLLLFTKATSLSNTVEMYIAADYPLCLKYMVSDLGELQLCQSAVVDDDEILEDMD